MPIAGGVDTSVYIPFNTTQKSFRLIQILPTLDDHIVTCQIANYRLVNQRGSYIGVSYTWGPEGGDKWIYLNGHRFPVRTNLFILLQALRCQYLGVSLWVDALCIDQSSIRERNHQVAFMGDIYREASSVLAWTGPTDEDSDWLFDFLNRADYQNSGIRFIQGQSFRFLLALQRYLERVYWSRIWIIQELVLAKDITLVCGDRSLRLQQISNLFSVLSNQRVDALWQWTPQLTTLSQVLATRNSMSSLEDLFAAFGRNDCAVSHDKIYALLGMTPNWNIEMSRKITIDYGLPIVYLLYELIESYNLHTSARKPRPLDFARKFVDTVDFDIQDCLKSTVGNLRVTLDLDLKGVVGSTTSEQPEVLTMLWPSIKQGQRPTVADPSFFREQNGKTNDWHICIDISDSNLVQRGDLFFRLASDHPEYDLVVRRTSVNSSSSVSSVEPTALLIGLSMWFWHPHKTGEESEDDPSATEFLSAFAADASICIEESHRLTLRVSFYIFVSLAKYLSTKPNSNDMAKAFG